MDKYIMILFLFIKKTKPSYNSSHCNATSFLLQITQFTYKTFKCNELLKWSRCCKFNTFALFPLVGENLLFFWSMYAPAPILFSLCVHSMEGRLISHSNISVGNGKMAEMHAEATPFIRASERETLAQLTGKMWHFLHCDTSHLQIDALSEIDRRRRNECASVTQRHATRTLWGLCSGAFWLVCFLKHRGPAVYVIQI